MVKNGLVIIADYTQQTSLSLEELCEICSISAEFLNDLIAYQIIHPAGNSPDQWVFDLTQLQRVKIALRLQRDLEVNLAGAALVLDLLEEMEQLRTKAALLEKHYSKF